MEVDTKCRGQIVAVILKNFMCFDHFVMRPGLNLNIVIGPNGSGKSTFACAVFLALGGNLQSLGMANKAGGYVKSGCEECFIEIELHEPKRENVFVGRRINTRDHSEYFINKKQCSLTKVKKLRKDYKIHLENLCSFLPQEKVQDFSNLNPKELLEQTLKAVGEQRIIKKYYDLKKLHADLVTKEAEVRNIVKTIESYKVKNERVKESVQIFRENKILYDRMLVIKQKKAWVSCEKEYKKYNVLKKRYLKLKGVYLNERRDLDAVAESVIQLKNEVGKHYELDETFEKEKLIEEDELRIKLRKFREATDNIENFDNIVQARWSEEEVKKMIHNLFKEEFDKLNNDLAIFYARNGMEDELISKEREIMKKMDDVKHTMTEIALNKENLEKEMLVLETEEKNISAEFDRLRLRGNARLDYIRRYESDALHLIKWLKENQCLFRNQIQNPLMLQMDLKNSQFAKYLENCIPIKDLSSFVSTDVNDFFLFLGIFINEVNYRINAVFSKPENIKPENMDRYKPEIPLDQIRHLGFYAYLIDVIVAPNHVLEYLCRIHNIHNIPIGDENVTLHWNEVPDKITCFFSDKHKYSVKYSPSTGKKSVCIRPLEDPKLFNTDSENSKIKEMINEKIRLLRAIDEMKVKHKLGTSILKLNMEKLYALRKLRIKCIKMNHEKFRIKNKIFEAQRKVNEAERRLLDELSVAEELRVIYQHAKYRFISQLDIVTDAYTNWRAAVRAKFENELKHKDLKIRVQKTSKLRDMTANNLRLLELDVDRLKSIVDKSFGKYEQLRKEALALTEGFSPQDEGFKKFEKDFSGLQDNIDDLEIELEVTQKKAKLLHDVDHEVCREYEQREQCIARLSSTLEETTKKIEEMKAEMSYMLSKWLGRLNDLVVRINISFSLFFEYMRCMGEVNLCKGKEAKNIEEYGIEIKVKFRNDTPMQKLGRHFQSGGERALATAVYLLALQDLSRIPFRFVDEINQGMDELNERRILNLLVNLTNDISPTQYFYLTPKLLPKINCSDSMVVHFLYTGLNRINADWDLNSLLDSER